MEIIGHEFTRRMLAAGESTRGRSYRHFVTSGIPVQIAQLTKQIDGMPDGPAKDNVREQLSIQLQYREASAAVKVQPPTVTLTDSMTLYRGGREIRLLFLGRGHTGGDVVVYLPKERSWLTGDLLTAAPSYMGDAFVPTGRRRSTSLGARLRLGAPRPRRGVQGKVKIDHFKSYLADFWQQAKKLHDSGVSAEEAARQIDMRKHIADYPEVPALKDVGVLNHGVYRAYDLLEGRIQ